jgi:hypothetical protein
MQKNRLICNPCAEFLFAVVRRGMYNLTIISALSRNRKRFTMMKRSALVVALLVLSACNPVTSAIDSGIAQATPQTGTPTEGRNSDTPHCELVNGPRGCTGLAAIPNEPQQRRSVEQAYRESGMSQYMLVVGACLDRLTDFKYDPRIHPSALDHCSEEADSWQAAQYSQTPPPAPIASSPQTTSTGFQGCVWRGRAYQRGDRIGIDQGQGLLSSSDLTINGRSFGAISGSNGPWQICECQRSIGQWGCV